MGWRLSRNDTGIWDVTSLAQDRIKGGKIFVQRVGNLVFIRGDNITVADVPAGAIRIDLIPTGGLPVGMRPQISMWATFVTESNQVRKAAASASGWVPIYGAKTGDRMHFQIMYAVSGPFPSAIPGVKV